MFYINQICSYFELPCATLSGRPIARLIGGSGGKSDEKSGQWENLRRVKIRIEGDRR